ncbi:hypothetical protein B1748_05160 [Paenibacillus sp. MY03]|nr:hypothetical protein B1748_05160 [Paenibacillus sp. MY03]
MKWSEGFRCPKCQHDACYAITTRNNPLYKCKKCTHRTTLTVCKISEKTRTDLTVWFLRLKPEPTAPLVMEPDGQVAFLELAEQKRQAQWTSEPISYAMTGGDDTPCIGSCKLLPRRRGPLAKNSIQHSIMRSAGIRKRPPDWT